MFDKLEIFDKRFEELNKRMYEPDVAADPVTFREVNKELSSITPIVEKYREYKSAKQAIEDALSLLDDSSLDDEMKELPGSVKNFEPHLALHGGVDGLEFYQAISKNYARILKPGGLLCFEFGMGQGDDVCKILEMNGYTVLERSRDYNDRERAVIARYDRKEE